ncbi:substrate-binding domain-containing protein [Kaistia dalseonensis]|uniref:LacI family transcriptional regulator n=1 Tax=Kaistia dalseonensis TaxID=410840 RepID=A0ABU0HAL3_9HYPH|nr:substrate-binding domain-containing protein [Kaistia dalseonensis]MCX5495903.1 substrate-binding domain-containing protein [Kaistia dalseonensis]MDQ0438506.1 LacI family transcriptional regulator [Kaistia dalseonensis]
MKLKELASHLGLSQTTVSRALNGYPEVNEETRQRVMEAARRHDYRPNASARRLATGRAGAIGIVLPTDRNMLLDPHYIEFQAGLGERLLRDEIDIVLSPTKGSDELATYRRMALGGRVDAVILSSPTVVDERVGLLTELGLPFVLHGRTESHIPHAWLDIDNEGAFHHATKHLLDLGHRRIGLINGETRHTFARDRENGFRRALNAHGLAVDEAFVANGLMTDEIGYRITARFLAERPRPTALLVSSMMMSLGAFRAIRAAGLELGRDVSMIAHDDVFPFLNPDVMVPTMSTTRSSIRAAGKRVGELLMELLVEGRAPETIHELWPVELVVRGSTGPAPRD